MSLETVQKALDCALDDPGESVPAVPAPGNAEPSPQQPAEKPAKKRPGRPKKTPPAPTIARHGVVDTPVASDNVLEMSYDNPTLFSKLVDLYKHYGAGELELNFDRQELRIFSRDSCGKINIYATIYGKCMNWYYCKEPVRVCISCESLHDILKFIIKDVHTISFILKKNFRSIITIVLGNIKYKNNDTYDLNVIFKPENHADRVQDDDTNHPLKFKIPWKLFKSRIVSIGKMANMLTIQRSPEVPLQFTMETSQVVSWTSVYRDAEKIELISTLPEDDVLSVTVPIAHIQPFTRNVLGDDIYFAVDKQGKISLTTYLDRINGDWACCIKVFTVIKDSRIDRPE